MVRHKIKKAVAIAMSAVIALTAVPNLPLQYEKKAEAATTEISSADVTNKYNKYFNSSNNFIIVFLSEIKKRPCHPGT